MGSGGRHGSGVPQRRDGPQQCGDDGEQHERRQGAHHEREGQLDRQRARLALGPAPALAADVVGQAIEHRTQRQAVAVGGGEGVDEGRRLVTERIGEREQRVGESLATVQAVLDLVEYRAQTWGCMRSGDAERAGGRRSGADGDDDQLDEIGQVVERPPSPVHRSAPAIKRLIHDHPARLSSAPQRDHREPDR